MIDIHHHCIPGVDDGAKDMAEAVAMCRIALSEGIETIVATPHVLRGRWTPLTVLDLETRLSRLRDAVGSHPRLLLGTECYFSHDVVEKVTAGALVAPLAGSRYFLTEFASDAVPPHADRPFHQLQLARWTPIIAHPERNAVFNAQPDFLAALVAVGARTQITAGSLVGQFGPTAKRSAETWVQAGLVHFVATDAHNVRNRLPVVEQALARLRKIAGAEVAEALMVHNPRAVIEHRALPFVPAVELAPHRGFLSRLKSFLQVR